MHEDINGNRIQLGDIVVIHAYNIHRCRDNDCNICKVVGDKVIGTEGVVIGFGCVCVEVADPICKKASTVWVTLGDKEVEVIGNVRPD